MMTKERYRELLEAGPKITAKDLETLKTFRLRMPRLVATMKVAFMQWRFWDKQK